MPCLVTTLVSSSEIQLPLCQLFSNVCRYHVRSARQPSLRQALFHRLWRRQRQHGGSQPLHHRHIRRLSASLRCRRCPHCRQTRRHDRSKEDCPVGRLDILLQRLHPDLRSGFRHLRRRPHYPRCRRRFPLHDGPYHPDRDRGTARQRYDGRHRVYLSHRGIHAVVLGRLRLPFHASRRHVVAGSVYHPDHPLRTPGAHVLFPPRDSSMAGQKRVYAGKSSDSCRSAFQRRYRSRARPEGLPRDSRGCCL